MSRALRPAEGGAWPAAGSRPRRLPRLARPWWGLGLCVLLAAAPPPALAAATPGSTAVPTAADTDPQAAMRADSSRYIVLAVDNPQYSVPQRAGTSLQAYLPPKRYGIGAQAAAALAALQREHGLQPVAAWPIAALGLHCVVYGLAPQASREAVLRALAADPRVRLAQPLQDFTPQAAAPAHYNDPYVALQRGFVETAAARAHAYSTGRDVAVAVVDTGADRQHPDLAGRVLASRDLVGQGAADLEAERHGTEVAGVIAATANNGQGIVGIAPEARLLLYRACWQGSGGDRCNSFTLAKALAAVLDSPARIVNLSLGGPADPLLEALLQQLLRQRRIVIAALPPSGRREGFPAGVPGVLVAGIAGTPLPPDVLPAPGRDVLTLVPGGRYDYASGSSIAAAHATGVAALLLAAEPRLDAAALQALLVDQAAAQPAPTINAEAALLRLARRPAWAIAP